MDNAVVFAFCAGAGVGAVIAVFLVIAVDLAYRGYKIAGEEIQENERRSRRGRGADGAEGGYMPAVLENDRHPDGAEDSAAYLPPSGFDQPSITLAYPGPITRRRYTTRSVPAVRYEEPDAEGDSYAADETAVQAENMRTGAYHIVGADRPDGADR